MLTVTRMGMLTSTATAHSHEHVHGDEHHRSLSTILGIIRSAAIDEAVKQRSTRAFQLLGEAEAGIHSIPVEQVHFHEVGAVDTIVDIVCAAAGASWLGADRWMASPLNVGSGTVECAHGTLAGSRSGHACAAGRCADLLGRTADGARHADGSDDSAHAGCASTGRCPRCGCARLAMARAGAKRAGMPTWCGF